MIVLSMKDRLLVYEQCKDVLATNCFSGICAALNRINILYDIEDFPELMELKPIAAEPWHYWYTPIIRSEIVEHIFDANDPLQMRLDILNKAIETVQLKIDEL